jgi:lysophospholipase L1-like esterase
VRWVVVLVVCLPLFALLGSGEFGSTVGTVSAFAGVRPIHGPQPAHEVLALGDSVPSGRACDCDPFPVTYGAELSRRTGARVTVDNRAVSGLDTEGLMGQLQGADMQDAVRRADIVLITIGANDFGDHHDDVVTGACTQGNSDCVSDELSALRTHLASVIGTIRALRGGQQTEILVTGYWNVFEDGDVAREQFGAAGLQQSIDLTRRANAVIDTVSTDSGARYVDLFTPFEESGRDVTSLVAADGDHPDAAGHELIANALLDAWTPSP